MRMCFDAGPLENGHRVRGIGWCTQNILRALSPEVLAEHGVDLTYLKRVPLGEDVPTGGRFARRSWVVDWVSTTGRLPPQLTSRWRSFAGPLRMAADVVATGSEVVFSTDPNAIPLSRHFATVALLYDLIPLRFPAEYLPRRALLWRANYAHQIRRVRKADHLIAISEATRRDAVELLGICPERISVAYLAVDPDRFSPVAQELVRTVVTTGYGIDRPYFLYVGGIDSRKNIGGLIRAFSQIIDESDAVLVMAGEGGAEGESFRQQLQGSPVGERIRWIGFVPESELPALYGGALALVYPSLYEGFGLPVLEAMSCGTPVMTARLSSLPEVAGDAALYTDPTSPPAMAAALRRLATEHELRAELRERGLEQARKFSWAETAQQILKVCRSVAEGRCARGRSSSRPS